MQAISSFSLFLLFSLLELHYIKSASQAEETASLNKSVSRFLPNSRCRLPSASEACCGSGPSPSRLLLRVLLTAFPGEERLRSPCRSGRSFSRLDRTMALSGLTPHPLTSSTNSRFFFTSRDHNWDRLRPSAQPGSATKGRLLRIPNFTHDG